MPVAGNPWPVSAKGDLIISEGAASDQTSEAYIGQVLLIWLQDLNRKAELRKIRSRKIRSRMLTSRMITVWQICRTVLSVLII